MKRILLVVACTNGAIAFLNAGMGVRGIVLGRPLYLLAVSCAATALTGAACIINIRKYLKEKALGSNRTSEASASDPGAGTFDITITADTSALTDALRRTSGLAAARHRALNSGGLVMPGQAPPEPEIEHVEGDMPILAHRIARLTFDGTSLPFKPLHRGRPFGVDSTARCEVEHAYMSVRGFYESRPKPHTSPGLDCQCGFYSVPSDVEPWGEGHDFVTLLVELSGTVIEHEKGYRAEHQRVVECQVPACRYCGNQSAVIDVRSGQMYEATCKAHVAQVAVEQCGDGRVLIDVADLSLPVPTVPLGRSVDAGALGVPTPEAGPA